MAPSQEFGARSDASAAFDDARSSRHRLHFGRVLTEAVRGVCSELLVPVSQGGGAIDGIGVKYAVSNAYRLRAADAFSFQLERLAGAVLDLNDVSDERLESVDQAFGGFISLILPSAHSKSDSELVCRRRGLAVVEKFFRALLSSSVRSGVKYVRLLMHEVSATFPSCPSAMTIQLMLRCSPCALLSPL